MNVTVVAPDERALREHIASARFQANVDAGRWRVISIDWPVALIAVAASPREGAPNEFVLRFELAGYPQVAPTAAAWSTETDSLLPAASRPKGEHAGHVFREDWEQGRALYAPWDRIALDGHGDWATKYPRQAWNARRDLTFYLTNVSEVLNSEDYVGV